MFEFAKINKFNKVIICRNLLNTKQNFKMKLNNNEKIWSRFPDIVSDVIHFTASERPPAIVGVKNEKFLLWEFWIHDCDARFLSTSNNFLLLWGHVFWAAANVFSAAHVV